jgi:hypothetical protein
VATGSSRDFRGARWVAVVATLVVLVAAVATVARNAGHGTSIAAGTPTAAPTPADCGTLPVSSYDGNNTIFTISPNLQPIGVELSADRTRVCSGGSVAVRVTLTNQSGRPQQIEDPALSLTGGFLLRPALGPVELGPFERREFTTVITLPLVTPGTAEIRLDGFPSAVAITIEGPNRPTCGGGTCNSPLVQDVPATT